MLANYGMDVLNIEQIQHDAPRIITGFPKFFRLESLYIETGLEQLSSNKKKIKYVLQNSK